jgi:hypothetical protein
MLTMLSSFGMTMVIKAATLIILELKALNRVILTSQVLRQMARYLLQELKHDILFLVGIIALHLKYKSLVIMTLQLAWLTLQLCVPLVMVLQQKII